MLTRTHTLHLTKEEMEELRWVLRDAIELLETEISECLAVYEDRSAEIVTRKSILRKIEGEE